MAAVDTARSEPSRGFFLNDPVVRGVIYQIVTAVLVVGFAIWIIGNTAGNLAAQNKTTGFDFLWRTAGFDISFSLLPVRNMRVRRKSLAYSAGLLKSTQGAVQRLI